MSYQKLWNQFITGNEKALSLLFLEFYDHLFQYAFKICNSKSISDDSLHDLFLKLWKNREKLSHVTNIRAYLYTSLRNLLLDTLKWNSKFIYNMDVFEDLKFEFSHEDILISRQIDSETKSKIIHVLNELPSKQKEAIYLRFFDNQDYNTISQIMNISIQSVRNNIYRGLQEMKKVYFAK